MGKIDKNNYLQIFVILFILTGSSFAIFSFGVFHFEQSTLEEEIFKDKANLETKLHKNEFSSNIKYSEDILKSIIKNRFLDEYIQNENLKTYTNLKDFLFSIVQMNKNIMQLRYINEKGKEKIRVDRKKSDDLVYIVDEKNLQNKSKRYYFINAINSKEGEIYSSKLDLNIENEKIVLPYEPVIRFAIPIFIKGEKKGIIVLNIFMEELLKRITSSTDFHIYIYNNKNYLLYSNDNNMENWQEYLKVKKSLKKTDFIYKDEIYINSDLEKLYIGLSIKNRVIWLDAFTLKTIIILTLLVVPISIILAYFISKIPIKLFKKLEKQQKMLIYQSKLAAMGEMIGAIAHQWRQPINAVGVLSQEIQLKFQLNRLDDEEMSKLSGELQASLEYMSNTIDDFRNFFLPSKHNKIFNVENTIKDAIKIIHKQFENHNIDIRIDVENKNSEYLINFNDSEFKQVIINILNNSKDAIEEKFSQNILETKRIIIDISKDDNFIIIRISDNGGGIKEEVLENIFEAYFTTKKDHEGMGIGLYMSQIIIEEHMKGKITAKNIKDGAEFEIKILAYEIENNKDG
ncbi:MAG: hypothetical protein C0625_07560 [Arcobacter sp.]|nr:MAG: hypothetical protein C0625_07560 [Arcobacter sp.]